MLAVPISPVPVIEISFAPPEEPQIEPKSPFSPTNAVFHNCVEGEDGYRSSLLTPPPFRAPGSSPLSGGFSMKKQGQGRGLGEAEFAALLKTSKDRSATAAARRQQDLRKEVTMKAHKNKQAERRAHFLSKIGAPPSPTAVSLPKTPPDSPAIFHYSLPSPGLCSPLAVFETLNLDENDSQMAGLKPWVEQVDFRLPTSRCMPPSSPSLDESGKKVVIPSISVTKPTSESPRRPGHTRKSSLPSLEQITERYSERTPSPPAPTTTRVRAPLPAFLHARCQPPASPAASDISNEREVGREESRVTETAAARTRPPRLASTGRIQFPVRSSPSPPAPEPPCPSSHARRRTVALSGAQASPASPKLSLPPTTPTLQVTPMHVPRAASSFASFAPGPGPKLERASLTKANLAALDSRARTARDMLSAVRRRTTVVVPSNGDEKFQFVLPMATRPLAHSSLEDGAAEMLRKLGAVTSTSDYEKMQRRNSSPAELIAAKKRTGAAFSHPVLAQPGGF